MLCAPSRDRWVELRRATATAALVGGFRSRLLRARMIMGPQRFPFIPPQAKRLVLLYLSWASFNTDYWMEKLHLDFFCLFLKKEQNHIQNCFPYSFVLYTLHILIDKWRWRNRGRPNKRYNYNRYMNENNDLVKEDTIDKRGRWFDMKEA